MNLPRAATLLNSEDSELRRQAIALVSNDTGERVIDLLVGALADEDWRVRKEAVRALLLRPAEPYAVSTLVGALYAGDNIGLRNAAVEALGGYGSLAVRELAARLPLLDADGRKLAADALARCTNIAAFEPLARLANDEDPNVKGAAIEAVAEVGRFAPELASPILERALEEKDGFLLLVTLDTLSRLGLTTSWERLEPLLKDPMLVNSGLRLAAHLGQTAAAPDFVKQLAEAHGQSWRSVLESLVDFIDSSEAILSHMQGALAGLSESTRARLLGQAQVAHDPGACSAALITLAVHGDGRAAELAIHWLSDDRIAAAAYRALSILGARAFDALQMHLDSEQALERAACVELLSKLAEREGLGHKVLAALRPLAEDSSTSVVRSWLTAMAKIGDERALVRAVEWLSDDVPAHVRRAAAITVRVCATRFPDRAQEIARGVGPKSKLAAAVAIFIGALPGSVCGRPELDLEFLTTAVSNERVVVRVAALGALVGYKSEQAADAIAFALNDEIQEVQLAALRALGRIKAADGSALGTERLLQVARSSRDPFIAVVALQGLGDTGAPAAVALLGCLASDPIAWRAVAAVDALTKFPIAEWRSAVQGALSHPDVEVVKAALKALRQDKEAGASSLISCLDHKAWDVRRLAADLLAGFHSPGAQRALNLRLGRETESRVVESIRRSLRLSAAPRASNIVSAQTLVS